MCVPRTGLEPACPFEHHPLKVARLPISPPVQVVQPIKAAGYPRTTPISIKTFDAIGFQGKRVIPPGLEPGTL